MLTYVRGQGRTSRGAHVYFPIDVSALESPENSTFEFPLVLDRSTGRAVTVVYETRPLTATRKIRSCIRHHHVAPGETSATISVKSSLTSTSRTAVRVVFGLESDVSRRHQYDHRHHLNDDTAIQSQRRIRLPTATPARPSCGQTNSKAMNRPQQLDLRWCTWLGQPELQLYTSSSKTLTSATVT